MNQANTKNTSSSKYNFYEVNSGKIFEELRDYQKNAIESFLRSKTTNNYYYSGKNSFSQHVSLTLVPLKIS
jgi:hypothetical protein